MGASNLRLEVIDLTGGVPIVHTDQIGGISRPAAAAIVTVTGRTVIVIDHPASVDVACNGGSRCRFRQLPDIGSDVADCLGRCQHGGHRCHLLAVDIVRVGATYPFLVVADLPLHIPWLESVELGGIHGNVAFALL